MAKNLKGLVSVNAIDCDVDANKGICGTYDIKGFPTIKVFGPQQRKNKQTGKMTKVSSGRLKRIREKDGLKRKNRLSGTKRREIDRRLFIIQSTFECLVCQVE